MAEPSAKAHLDAVRIGIERLKSLNGDLQKRAANLYAQGQTGQAPQSSPAPGGKGSATP